jgi:RNA 3'-phosphate cyclase
LKNKTAGEISCCTKPDRTAPRQTTSYLTSPHQTQPYYNNYNIIFMLEIDGGYLESGGQILRTSIALSAIKKIPCHVFNIRKSRPKPGLQTQHLLGIQNIAKLCNGYLEGDEIGSEEIKFYPGEITTKDLHIKIETAASITLCLQSLLPVALSDPNPIKIFFEGGGTDVPFSPTFDHFRYVFLKILEKMLAPLNSEGICSGGAKVEINILRRGYYPEGSARVKVMVFPSKLAPYQTGFGVGLKPLNLTERGQLQKILVISGASEFLRNKKVSERQLMGMREILGRLKLPIEEKMEYYDTRCPGSQICLIAEFTNLRIGVDNLGKLGKPAETIGREAALELLKEEKTKACLDQHLADQVLPYMALTQEENQVTVSEITLHAKTNIWIIEKFIPGKFEVKGNIIKWIPKN